MGNINRVIFINKIYFEAQSVSCLLVPWDFLYLLRGLEVLYIMTISVPAIPRCLNVLFRIYKWLHALVIGWVWFVQINDVKCVFNILAIVLYSKVIPLRHCLMIRRKVRPQLKIIYIVSNLGSSSQVARFKPRFKDKRAIARSCRRVELSKLIIVPRYFLINMHPILFSNVRRHIEPHIPVFYGLIQGIKAIINEFSLVFIKHYRLSIYIINKVGHHLVSELIQLLLDIHALPRMKRSLQ